MTGNPPAVRVDGLRVTYPGAAAEAVSGVGFELASGEVFGLLGPNGAGKSTVQAVLTGRLRDFEGRAEVLGRSVRDWGRELYRHVGVCFELPAAFPKLSVRENLELIVGLYGGATMPVGEALELTDLEAVASSRPAQLSKGMRQRLNLARALLHRPSVLFLDEPTSGLDPRHVAAVGEVVADCVAEGCAVLLTTHDMDAAESWCSRVGFMLDGKLKAADTPRALRLAHGSAAVTVEHRVEGALRRRVFELSSPTDPELLEFLRDAEVETIHTREAALKDVFVRVAGDLS